MESLSMQLQPFFQWLLRTTLQASLLICLILFFQIMLRSRLGARWHYCLWLLLLIRLAIPWAPQSRLSIFNLIPQSITHQQSEYVRQEIVDDTVDSALTSPSATEPKPTSTTIIPQDSPKAITAAPQTYKEAKGRSRPIFSGLEEILPLIWLTGALVLGLYVAAGNFHLWRLVTHERPLTDQSILDLLEDCKSQMGIRTILGVVITDKVNSPALFGFVRPRLLLPKGMLETLSCEELRYIFLHELAHLKRHDIYIGYLSSLLQVLHWFNPLIWLAFYRIRTDRELACDALVLAQTHSSESKDYGRTIVSLLERFSLSQRLPAMAGILETKAQLKRRLTMIAKFKKNSYKWSPLAAILIIILACISMPDAKRTKASRIQNTRPAAHITLRRVWSNSYPVTDGEPSPDGRYLSYTDWETGDLAICEIATRMKRRLTDKGTWDESDECAYSSIWSPDNKQLAYCWEKGKDSVDLRIIGLDGSGPRTIYSTGEQTRWVEPCGWFPDGKRILAHLTGKDGTDQVVQISVADKSLRVLKTVGKDCLGHVRFSPDGRYIAYDFRPEDNDNSSNHDISLISTDGSREIRLVEHPADDFVLGWAPDGKNILFASDRTGVLGIWRITVADGKTHGTAKLVKQIAGRFEPMGFTREGSYYYSTSRASDNAYIATLDTEANKITTPPTKAVERYEGSIIAATYSPDGKYIAYIYKLGFVSNNRSRKNILCIRSLKTEKEREFSLNLSNILRYSSLRWFPDSRSILVGGYKDKDSLGIYRVDVRTGEVKYLVRSNTCEVSHDGKAIFYRNSDPEFKVSRIVMRNLESDNEEVLYRSPSDELIFNIALSPDGRSLALRCIRPTSLKIVPVGGGNFRELPEFEKAASVHKPIAWTADGKYILFSGKEALGGKHPLSRISVESGKVEKLGVEKNQYFTLSVHPDGQHVLISGSESAPESEVWVMENFLPEAPVAKPEPMTTVRRIGGDWGTFASLSPDGKYMCDVDWDTERLAVLELATGKIRHITSKSPDEAYPLYSAISPDSKEVAYLWWDPDTKASSLHIVGLDSSGHRLLCKGKYPMPREWSSDSKKIFTIISENDVQQMVWISASDGSIQSIASFNGESLGYPGKFDVSPDGRFIAYDRPQDEDTSNRDIFVFELSENREFSVVKHPANDKLLGWTPDGKHVLFASNRMGSWDAWLLQAAGGRPQGFPELAKHGIGDVRPIGFTPQGSYYYGHEQILNDVFMARLDLETGEFLSEPVPVRQTGATASHDWSPDGLYLAYCQRRGDRSQAIHIRTLATGRERTLATNIPYIRWLRWTPDMRSFLIDGYKRGDSQGVISKIDVKTGERNDIIQSTTEVLIRPEMSPDGKTLFYDRINPTSRTMRVVARDMESGREKELFRVSAPAQLTGSALSPDGQRIALSIVPSRTGPEGPVLKILSTSGGQPRELLQLEKSEKLRTVGVTWTPDSQNVLFWKWFQGDKELELWRISAEGGEPRKLCSRKAFGHMRVHPDGQHVAFYDRSTTRGVWVMENFLPRVVTKAK